MEFYIKKGIWLMRLGKYLSSLTKPEIDDLAGKLNLSDDENAVFYMLSLGKSNTNIANKMCICDRTVCRISKKIRFKISRLREGV